MERNLNLIYEKFNLVLFIYRDMFSLLTGTVQAVLIEMIDE